MGRKFAEEGGLEKSLNQPISPSAEFALSRPRSTVAGENERNSLSIDRGRRGVLAPFPPGLGRSRPRPAALRRFVRHDLCRKKDRGHGRKIHRRDRATETA